MKKEEHNTKSMKKGPSKNRQSEIKKRMVKDEPRTISEDDKVGKSWQVKTKTQT